MATNPTVNIDPLVANMASTHISAPFPPAPAAGPADAPAPEAPPRSSQSVEINLLNSIKPQLSVSPASPDYSTLRAAAVKERSEVNIENSPEEALRREIKALRAGRTRHNIALKELVRIFQRIRGMSVRNQLMSERVARMRLDLSAIKRARNAALDSRRRARQARARAVAARVNVAGVRAQFGSVEDIRRGVRGLQLDEAKAQASPSYRGVNNSNDEEYVDEDEDLAMASGEELGGTSQDERDAAEDEVIVTETEEDRAFTTPHAEDVAHLR